MMDEEKKHIEEKIVNHNTNCQVFNGPISGSIFAMPGSHVEQHPVQNVAADGSAVSSGEEPNANDDRLIVPIPEGLTEVIMKAPEATFKMATNPFTIRMVQDAGLTCVEPWHFACLLAVCDDYGILVDRGALTNFARTMVAWGIKKISSEDEVSTLANSMIHVANLLPLLYNKYTTY